MIPTYILHALICVSVVAFLVVVGLKRISMPTIRVVAQGSLLVSDTGSVVVDEVLPRTRALLIDPERYVDVEFDPNEPLPPPCAGSGAPDEVDWELFFEHKHGHTPHAPHTEELRLKISWDVSTPRTIIWKVSAPS